MRQTGIESAMDTRFKSSRNPVALPSAVPGENGELPYAETFPRGQEATAEQHVLVNGKLTYVIEMSKRCHL
jgi:hypothetical protein